MVIWVNKISMLEYEKRMTFLDRMMFLDKMTKEHIVYWQIIILDKMTFFRQNDKRTYFMTDFETQNLEHWTLKVNDSIRKGNWYNAQRSMIQYLKSNDTML